MFTVKGPENTYKVEWKDKTTVEIDGKEHAVDLVELAEGKYHLLFQHKSFTVQVVKINQEEKTMSLQVNGNPYEVEMKNKMTQLLESMGISAMSKPKVSGVKAPMPGKVLKVNVAVGDSIAKGQPLMMLEAMKMENIIKSPIDAVIKEVAVVPGDTVEKNADLVVFES